MKKIIALLVMGALLSGCSTTMVSINTNVEGAKVIVDGKLLGETPIDSVPIKNKTGSAYQVIIEKEGYKPFRSILQKEDKAGASVAVYIGYAFCWLLLPALLLINMQYMEGPVPDQYFVLEAAD